MAVAQISTTSNEEEATKKRERLPSPSKTNAFADSSANSPPPKRNKDPGVRVVGCRIYDSEHGKSCHQCRQKTRDFAAYCKNVRQGKPCTISFCHKCLLNRYGEKAEEVASLVDWQCPKCRGICNCSFCMKKRGQKPTGILVHAAKATGFSSVCELLHHESSKVSDVEMIPKDINPSPNKSPFSSKVKLSSSKEEEKDSMQCRRISKELLVKSKKKKKSDKMKGSLPDDNETKELAHKDFMGKTSKEVFGNSTRETNLTEGVLLDGKEIRESGCKTGADDASQPLFKVFRPKESFIPSVLNPVDLDTVLPQGTLLKTVADIELEEEDVGPILQFLEFCAAFGKVLRINKGEPEAVIRELAYMGTRRRRLYSINVQLHMKLLSVILKDMGDKPVPVFNNSGSKWLNALGKCIANSQCGLNEFPLDFSNMGSAGYENLEFSTKLRVLNFLCDEVLGTEELRNWMNGENAKFGEGRKETKEKVAAAKEKLKLLRQKLKDDLAKALLSSRDTAPLTVDENNDLISKVNLDTEIARANMLQSLNLVPKTKCRWDAVRTERSLLNGKGQVYWRLRSHCNSSRVILQDIGNWESVIPRDKWFIFEAEQEKVIEKHISSLSCRSTISNFKL